MADALPSAAGAAAAALPDGFLAELDRRVGARGWSVDPERIGPHAAEQWGTARGHSPLLLRPATTREVALVLELCHAADLPVVPQGGNTGLVGAGVPDRSGRLAVLSLGRLNRIRALDPAQRHDHGRGRLRARDRPAGGGRGQPPVPALARRPGLLPDRRQPVEQRRRRQRAALRHGARPGAGARGGPRRRPGVGRAARLAQGQHRLRPEAAVHRRRGHAGRDHRGRAAALAATAGAADRLARGALADGGGGAARPVPRAPRRDRELLRADGGRCRRAGAALPARRPLAAGPAGARGTSWPRSPGRSPKGLAPSSSGCSRTPWPAAWSPTA